MRLQAVGWFFVFGGLLSALEIAIALTSFRVSINFCVLGVPIGFGLLRLSPGWRLFALGLLWCTLAAIAVAAFLPLPGNKFLTFLGLRVSEANHTAFVLVIVASLAATIAAIAVLQGHKIRMLFLRGVP